LTQAVVGILVVLSVLAKMVELIRGCPEKVCTPDQVFDCVFTYVQNVFVQAVVAILVELSVFAKMVELMIGCEVNVVTPLKVELEDAVPILIEPVVKLPPIVMEELAFMTSTDKVDTLRTDTFVTEKF
jgi:hypothetical protein